MQHYKYIWIYINILKFEFLSRNYFLFIPLIFLVFNLIALGFSSLNLSLDFGFVFIDGNDPGDSDGNSGGNPGGGEPSANGGPNGSNNNLGVSHVSASKNSEESEGETSGPPRGPTIAPTMADTHGGLLDSSSRIDRIGPCYHDQREPLSYTTTDSGHEVRCDFNAASDGIRHTAFTSPTYTAYYCSHCSAVFCSECAGH